MALHTLGTSASTSLVSLAAWVAGMSDTDFGNFTQMIANDNAFHSILGVAFGKGATAVFGTGTTNSDTTLTSLVAGTGSSPLTQIKVGDIVLGPAFPAGTFVAALVSGTAITLSTSATTGTTGQNVAFLRPGEMTMGRAVSKSGLLYVPNRGVLRILPGDVAAYDPITGFPILVSAAAIAATGSVWSQS